MPTSESDDNALYTVVVNHEGQYSIWPSDKSIPAGWDSVGDPKSKADCLAYISEVWTDMRPRSLVAAMQKTSS